MKSASLNTNLDVDVDLRAWKQLGHDSSFESLFQVEAHLCGLAVPVGSPLPLGCTEGGHAVLAVDDSSIMPSSAAGAPHLGGDTITGALKTDRQLLIKRDNLTLRCPTVPFEEDMISYSDDVEPQNKPHPAAFS